MSVINTNLASLTAQQGLKKSQSSLTTSMERLSSGLRINSAKDDAAGQAIGNRIQAQRNGLGQSAQNANDGISLSQTAQGILKEVNERLQRIRELTVQGLNEIYNGEVGDRIQAEINLNLKEIDRLNDSSEFNGIPLLNGSAGTKSLQVGANDGETLDVDLNPPGFSVEELGLKDLTFQGRPDEITHVDKLIGRAYRIPIDASENITNFDSMYNPPDLSPHLVKFNGRDVVQLESDGGRLKNVSTSAWHDTNTLENQINISVRDAEVSSASGEYISYSSVDLQDHDGAALDKNSHKLVRSGGSYWLTRQENNEAIYYQAEITTLKGRDGSLAVTARALSSDSISHDDMSGYISDLDYTYSVSKSSADFSLELDGTEESGNPDVKLVKLGDSSFSRHGRYYVEERLADGTYQYYKADVEVTSGGDVETISVVSSREAMSGVVDQPYVSGFSTVHLKPENKNIRVDYIDLLGKRHEDVMVRNEDNGYTFNVNAFENAPGAVKTANVVTNNNGDYWLQTVNGSGEVVLYYPMSTSESTNVENNLTTITIREAESAQRIRNPAQPLSAIDDAMARVDKKLAEFGALDNRLGSVIKTNELTNMNLASAQSRILDADYAKESASLVRAQIVQQAGNSVLAQANTFPERVLVLIESSQ